MKKILAGVFLFTLLMNPSFSPAQETPAPPVAAPVPAAPLPAWLNYKSPYEGEENKIANPHRTPDEMVIWAQQAAAETLSFKSSDFKEKMTEFKKYFAESGWLAYITYLKDSKLADMVNEDGYSIGTIVNTVPEIVSHGNMDGAYHWIIRMPITLSFFNTDAASGKTRTGGSGKYMLYMDVMRVAEGGGENGIAINNWRVDDIKK